MIRILIWGCGTDFKIIMDHAIWNESVEIIGIIESIKSKENVVYKDTFFKVYGLDELEALEYEKIIVANASYREVLEEASRVGISKYNLVFPYRYEKVSNIDSWVDRCSSYIINADEIIRILDEQHQLFAGECILVGSGKYLEFLLSIARWYRKNQIVGVLDINKKLKGKTIEREITTLAGTEFITIRVYSSIEEIRSIQFEYFIVCDNNENEIKSRVGDIHVSDARWIVPYWTETGGKLDAILNTQCVWKNSENVIDTMTVFHQEQRLIQPMSCDMEDFTLMNSHQDGMRTLGMHNGDDYVRIRTLELLVRELKRKAVDGAMAEVGVFTGTFAKVMRWYYPKKKLYLFDTFEGFDQRDSGDEIAKGYFSEEWASIFENNSVEDVKKYIGDSANDVYRVGYFPESLQNCDMDEKYCLVSLDADMYGPTYAGLEYFYPRLVEGGYIMIHEYNAIVLDEKLCIQKLEGVRQAVMDFEKKWGHVALVPISDRNGTVIITK